METSDFNKLNEVYVIEKCPVKIFLKIGALKNEDYKEEHIIP
jgi:hypothetical protein